MNRRETFALGAGALALTACSNAATASAPHTDLSGFALNIESWFADDPFERRFDLAAKAGFEHVEFWFIDSWDRDATTLAKRAQDSGVKVAQIVGDTPELARPTTRAEFTENCKRAIENANILGTDIVTLTGHQNVEGVSKADSLKAYADHMAAVAPLFEGAKVFAAIEPFNPYNHPGHFIYGSPDAIEICRVINSPYVKINWDLFHMQRAEGNVIDNLEKGADQICYAQLADSPKRGQPGTGEMDYVNIIAALRATGYDRPIGLELWARDKDYARAVADIQLLSQRMSDQ